MHRPMTRAPSRRTVLLVVTRNRSTLLQADHMSPAANFMAVSFRLQGRLLAEPRAIQLEIFSTRTRMETGAGQAIADAVVDAPGCRPGCVRCCCWVSAAWGGGERRPVSVSRGFGGPPNGEKPADLSADGLGWLEGRHGLAFILDDLQRRWFGV